MPFRGYSCRRTLIDKQQIALLGESFNPVTKGHIEVARVVVQKIDIDEVWLTPCYGHLQKNIPVDSRHRLEMCKIAVKEHPHIKVSDYEITHQLSSGTCDFIHKLLNDQALSSQYDFSYIIGTDNIRIFETWNNHEELKKLIRFIVVSRKGESIPEDGWYDRFPNLYIRDPVMKVSSTYIRRLLKVWWANVPFISLFADRLLKNRIDIGVLAYIWRNELYK